VASARRIGNRRKQDAKHPALRQLVMLPSVQEYLSLIVRRGFRNGKVPKEHFPWGLTTPYAFNYDEAVRFIFPLPPEPHRGFSGVHPIPSPLCLSTIAVILVGLSLYAARSIISPLSAFAAAARAVGRTADGDQIRPERGPQEIVQVAAASMACVIGFAHYLMQENEACSPHAIEGPRDLNNFLRAPFWDDLVTVSRPANQRVPLRRMPKVVDYRAGSIERQADRMTAIVERT